MQSGTAAANSSGMFTISAFAIAFGSVFASVLWACKAESGTLA